MVQILSMMLIYVTVQCIWHCPFSGFNNIFSGNKSDYHFFLFNTKILLVTFPSSFDIAFMLWIRLFFTRLISIVHYC